MINNRYNKKVGKKVYVISMVITMLIAFLAITGTMNGMSMQETNNKGISEYKSIQDLINHTSYPICIPNFIYEYNSSELSIKDTIGQIAEIECNDFAFKASPLISYNVDVLGLYEKAEVDNMYTVSENENGIVFFRYRALYPEYEHCTIIDWCTTETTHGLLLGQELTEDEVLELFGIDNAKLTETSVKEILKQEGYINDGDELHVDTDISQDIIWEKHDIEDKYTIQLPKFTSQLTTLNDEGAIIYYLDKTMVFVIIYNDYDIDSNAFGGQSEEKLTDGLVLRYRTDNPFDKGTNSYDDYDKFINTISHIKETLIVK